MSESQRSNIFPVVIGMLVTSLFLAGLAYLANQRKRVEKEPAPILTLQAPANGAAVDSPLVVRFRSTRPLELKSSGWGYRSLHLHAWVDTVQVMPATDDIVAESSGYSWRLAIPRGSVRVHLGWADQAHRPVAAGGSDTVVVIVH